MNSNERIVYVEKRGIGIWGAIGWLLFFGLLFLVWKAVSTVNDVAGIFDTTAATLDAINAPEFQQQPGVVILSTSTPFPVVVQATATPYPTATAYPTYTAVPLLTLSDYGLPLMGPYTLEQVNQCREIVNSGNLDTMKSPQRELCEMYTK